MTRKYLLFLDGQRVEVSSEDADIAIVKYAAEVCLINAGYFLVM